VPDPSNSSTSGCLACDLTAGRVPLPGGRIHETWHWVVEHCIGTLGIGTVIAKPFRHVLPFAELTPGEASAFGVLMRAVTAAVTGETECDQTCICQWAHPGWEPGHLHFVVRPAYNLQRERFERPGPFLQVEMYNRAEPIDEAAVAEFCSRIRARLASVGITSD